MGARERKKPFMNGGVSRRLSTWGRVGSLAKGDQSARGFHSADSKDKTATGRRTHDARKSRKQKKGHLEKTSKVNISLEKNTLGYLLKGKRKDFHQA